MIIISLCLYFIVAITLNRVLCAAHAHARRVRCVHGPVLRPLWPSGSVLTESGYLLDTL